MVWVKGERFGQITAHVLHTEAPVTARDKCVHEDLRPIHKSRSEAADETTTPARRAHVR